MCAKIYVKYVFSDFSISESLRMELLLMKDNFQTLSDMLSISLTVYGATRHFCHASFSENAPGPKLYNDQIPCLEN